MKVFVVVFVFIAASIAEPPLSNSYLPPPPGQTGYPQGPSFGAGPQVIAARNLDQGKVEARGNAARGNYARGSIGNNFGRDGAQGKFGDSEQGYERSSSPFDRNAVEEASDPPNYNFGYMVNDYQEGTDFGHHEERQEERAQGEYHVVLPDGRKQTVSYEADERGFKPHITYEDTDSDDAARNGYDSNAHRDETGKGYGYNDANLRAKSYGDGATRQFANGAGNHGNGYNNARSNGY